MMSFIAKAFGNSMFVQYYMDKYAQKQERLKIGQKRRLTMSLKCREFAGDAVSIAMGINQSSNYTSQDEEELLNIQLEIHSKGHYIRDWPWHRVEFYCRGYVEGNARGRSHF
ncbi:unnamed protein product [Fraxinus pennsylvanica]|uniref:Uncharacterized protein n=1 Tax=Fraxinus pennsylvanica TaxID=56036 RepID=A0AAD2DGP7_9LAMI|nr:unnamed protein product [Fraxinus pennsylvanica]